MLKSLPRGKQFYDTARCTTSNSGQSTYCITGFWALGNFTTGKFRKFGDRRGLQLSVIFTCRKISQYSRKFPAREYFLLYSI